MGCIEMHGQAAQSDGIRPLKRRRFANPGIGVRDHWCCAPHAAQRAEETNGTACCRVASSVSMPVDTALPVTGQVIITHPIGFSRESLITV
jgi:hypothetical protein